MRELRISAVEVLAVRLDTAKIDRQETWRPLRD
jgi:hypothetical protein